MIKEYNQKNPNPINIAVGKAVREIRLSKGLSMEFVASKLYLTYQAQQAMENARNRFSADQLYTLSKLFRCSVNKFYKYVEGE